MAKTNRSPAGRILDKGELEERDIKIMAAWERGMNNRQIREAFNVSGDVISKSTRQIRLRRIVRIINKVKSGQIVEKEELSQNQLNPFNFRQIITQLRKEGYDDKYIEKCLGKKASWLASLDKYAARKREKRNIDGGRKNGRI